MELFDLKQRLCRDLNISDSITAGKHPCAEEGHVTLLKAPDQLLNRPCDTIFFVINNELSMSTYTGVVKMLFIFL